jgi:hypothetical protein
MNRQIEIMDKLNSIIDSIDQYTRDGTGSSIYEARNTATVLRDEIQDEIAKQESDIDIQLQLENESKYGK